jgi:hypothetical protein
MAGILRTDTIQNSNTSTIITQTNSTTITIGTTGQTVALASGATSSGFGATYNGAVNWDTTAKTTGFTAVSGVGYFCNTTSAAFTVTLPASPSAGAIVAITDYAGTAATNNITIARNGSNIEGVASNGLINTNRDSITLVYIDSTQGWLPVNDNVGTVLNPFISATGGTVLTCGSYKTHVFTGPGSFVVSNAGTPAGSNSVEYLVVAGGGATAACGGGGGGGYRQNYPSPTTAGLPVTSTTYPITVGAGGSSPGSSGPISVPGSNSIFSTITSAGGAGSAYGSPSGIGYAGGSGSGANAPGGSGGAGNTPPVSPPQGNAGGPAICGQSGGGGGGAGGVGSPNGGGANPGGAGGVGATIATAFFGPTAPSYGTPGPAAGRYFSGGGGARGNPNNYTGGAGGAGGGGKGSGTCGASVDGTVNTGGGAGGYAKSGGSGIVVIRYKYQ